MDPCGIRDGNEKIDFYERFELKRATSFTLKVVDGG